ncbi:phosphocholine-specific phospholipase C [Planctomicrobium sp. SH668]|uniref:phosphocholine-specific phospholipase C n=1 Tax=Planctomicrobium sp. SH668 TaxID=3448126 RepID=UPI003F5BF63B
MHNRRDFLKDILLMAGATGVQLSFIETLQKAAAIEPTPGSDFSDADHIVILMQENRSLDHVYGSLSGVRGFSDPRAVKLPDGNPSFVQTEEDGRRYAPFRVDMQESKATWMGCLPHGYWDQVAANNFGLHDKWLQYKRPGHKDYQTLPMTMGYYSRGDLPYYYALADLFTVCDHNFCSVISSTTPNRLHLWTGTILPEQKVNSPAAITNGQCSYGNWCNWTTYPERLEDNGISWKIYQNELDVPTGMTGEEHGWLSNFGDSPIEWFSQFNVRFHPTHRAYLHRQLESTQQQLEEAKEKVSNASGEELQKLNDLIQKLTKSLDSLQKDVAEFTEENFNRLSERAKSLHQRAFTTNVSDPHYRELETVEYNDEGKKRTINIPKGDVLYQFRKDVESGNLPQVSWIVPPGRFSDHPDYAWFGQWYLSEVVSILTQNPEVWKKTVFILTYDENDGFFDHIPPFMPPRPNDPNSGGSSPGLETALDHVSPEIDKRYRGKDANGNPIGLGYRVPMVIASPWTTGGNICSEVFDHTSVIRFLESYLQRKTGKTITETNISPWRRTICGDLTSAFRSASSTKSDWVGHPSMSGFIEQIDRMKYKPVPKGFHELTDEEITAIQQGDRKNSPLPVQEPGQRPHAPLNYELEVTGDWDENRQHFVLTFSARNKRFGDRSLGAPFIAYAETTEGIQVRHYAVAPGSSVTAEWRSDLFGEQGYVLRVHGPNGFYREFRGTQADPKVELTFYDLNGTGERQDNKPRLTSIAITNAQAAPLRFTVKDGSYSETTMDVVANRGLPVNTAIAIDSSNDWYDLIVTSKDVPSFYRRYAGRAESGAWGLTDPLLAVQKKA